MESLWLLVSATVFLSIATFLLCTNSTKFFRKNNGNTRPSPSSSEIQLPLGTLGWPFIGETIEFISCAYSGSPEKFMDKRRCLYGNVFKSHLFGSRTIVSTDAEVNKHVLDSKTFIPAYPRSLTELMGESSILVTNGNLHKKLHGLIGAFLKCPQLKAQITRDMQKYVHETVNHWKDDQLIYIQDVSKNAKKRMMKVIEKIIQEKQKHNSNEIPKDIIDVLLNDSNKQLTPGFISSNMVDFMIPAEDSVPVLITLVVKFLSECPRALEQMLEENMKLQILKDEMGGFLCWSDYMSLPFTQNVITEALRLGNIIGGVMRKATKDVQIKGYLIPEGWCVFAYILSVHLDDKHYDQPHQFNPWRWQDNNIGTCNFTPFGGGQRLCPGLELARLETSIFLHHFITQFSWVAEEDAIIHFPTARLKRRMPVCVKRR
ncbi:3-epi-6-deoxocathasterone 23-monooxygenase-like isoform X3 [Papaver somniferum]|uniref:3-epi-6-deoxocathasterone 23-monooxygenase-like isoform X3 n=1 Tax=Papaver somniferum TaxID=3469 RepID=UPI000E701B86|nr:3-epi-6-deoxocathasterone 23-monooxygenase-like isoform X3 [Papaver somniferum]